MKITIEIDEKTAKHLAKPHDFTDGCYESNLVLFKIQEEIEKQ